MGSIVGRKYEEKILKWDVRWASATYSQQAMSWHIGLPSRHRPNLSYWFNQFAEHASLGQILAMVACSADRDIPIWKVRDIHEHRGGLDTFRPLLGRYIPETTCISSENTRNYQIWPLGSVYNFFLDSDFIDRLH